MNTFNWTTSNTTYKDCYFYVSRYIADNSLYIEVDNQNGPITTLTVCLDTDDDKVLSDNMTFLDTNNCPDGTSLISELKLGSQIGFKSSGYCIYPCYILDIDEVKKYCLNPDEI